MSVNGVTGASDVYSAYSTASQTKRAETTAETTGEAKTDRKSVV